jgi:hypothetical protein
MGEGDPQRETKKAHTRTDHPQNSRRREAPRPRSEHRRCRPALGDHRVDLAPLAEPVRSPAIVNPIRWKTKPFSNPDRRHLRCRVPARLLECLHTILRISRYNAPKCSCPNNSGRRRYRSPRAYRAQRVRSPSSAEVAVTVEAGEAVGTRELICRIGAGALSNARRRRIRLRTARGYFTDRMGLRQLLYREHELWLGHGHVAQSNNTFDRSRR